MPRHYSRSRQRQQKRAGQPLTGGITALYTRVSTSMQVEEGYSLDAQLERLRAYCAAHNWLTDPAHIYTDAGLSGKSTDRPAFLAMVETARQGVVTRIVCTKLDRLARNVKDFLALVEELKTVECDLVLIQESFDSATPQGKFALTLFAAMAELESSTITERMVSGKTEKARTGGYCGAPAPYGYIYADGQWRIVDKEAAIIREIFATFLRGESLRAIARTLNARRVKTATDARWHATTVRYVLDNGFYASVAQWNNLEAVGEYPAIIDRETYQRASEQLACLCRGNPAWRQQGITA